MIDLNNCSHGSHGCHDDLNAPKMLQQAPPAKGAPELALKTAKKALELTRITEMTSSVSQCNHTAVLRHVIFRPKGSLGCKRISIIIIHHHHPTNLLPDLRYFSVYVLCRHRVSLSLFSILILKTPRRPTSSAPISAAPGDIVKLNNYI